MTRQRTRRSDDLIRTGTIALNTNAIHGISQTSKQAPEEQQRHGVVVSRNPPVEIAEHLLVDEIEPEEPVHVSRRRHGAAGVSLRRIGNPCRDMPGHRNHQEDQQAGKGMPAPQVPQVPIEQQEDDDNAAAGRRFR